MLTVGEVSGGRPGRTRPPTPETLRRPDSGQDYPSLSTGHSTTYIKVMSQKRWKEALDSNHSPLHCNTKFRPTKPSTKMKLFLSLPLPFLLTVLGSKGSKPAESSSTSVAPSFIAYKTTQCYLGAPTPTSYSHLTSQTVCTTSTYLTLTTTTLYGPESCLPTAVTMRSS
jgi:hypothetical protein